MLGMPEAFVPARTLLGFDVGTVRVGVAVGNTVSGTAQALQVIDAARAFEAIERLMAEWQPDAFVVGLPLHEDGSDTQGSAPARKFANRLKGRYGRPVAFVDERFTSTEAQSRYGKMAPIDHHAAALILQQYLDDPARPDS
jgi:putative Holliday junction resolvase